ncbi:MAG: DUF4127 family protein [Armatimonadota bacterium]|nr:DUF4127 family protein [Armatimonadota bacterium]MDR7450757.1 DUF4127 family protein [Armatimonadota bacterium]MDR7466113.1 DUF4127 family protein [Armatimonadota bacterium]MDR7493850.1 DUF4127 family protein [Armatimonadota bacterium]MDR7498989.1 DUF4127 family protein [Armatimonadota bacterium]
MTRHPVLLFVPLDDRPVTCDMVVELAEAAGAEVRTPDRALLGDRDRPGDVRGIWEWLEAAARRGDGAALIASAEMLCLGGLVASRKSEAEFEEIAPLLERLVALAARLPVYVSAVIPRTPVVPTDEDAPYWAAYGDALRSITAGAEGPQPSVPEALDVVLQAADLPDPVREAVRRQRGRHLRINARLIAAAASGAIRYLLIGQDDTAPGSLSQIEREALQALVDQLAASGVMLTSGADELNARLLARWLNDLTGRRPSVRALYTFPWRSDGVPLYEAQPLNRTVAEHVASAGCVPGGDDPEIVLWVHNFEDRQREAQDQHEAPSLQGLEPLLRAVRAAVREDRVVALADVRFANGGDRELVTRLLDEPRFAGIVAYAGWNTCSNALGSAISQAVVACHLRAYTLPGDDRRYRLALFRRLLEDWGYQSVVRPLLTRWIIDQGGRSAELGEHEAEAERRALEGMRDVVLPPLQRSYRYHPIDVQQVIFPWHRLFEVRIALQMPATSRGRQQIVVVDYDPDWPRRYEEERAAIVQTLGPLLRGIEHVGSTAVPGLAAKPIIDIMVGVAADDLDGVIEPLAVLGYEYGPDWEISMPLRRYFRRLAPDGSHTHHLHVVPYGEEFWTRHLRFRDYLRTHPEAVRAYGDLKKRLAATRRESIDYTFAKTEFILSTEAEAGVVHRR